MAITGRNILSIVECVFYAPATILSLFLCIRHCCRGERAQIAWIFLYLYCHIRVAEAVLGLATITFPSVAVYGTSILFSLIGVPTLLLTTFGLLNRVHINLAKNFPTRMKAGVFSLLQIPFEAAIPLCVKGASNSTADLSNGGTYQPCALRCGIFGYGLLDWRDTPTAVVHRALRTPLAAHCHKIVAIPLHSINVHHPYHIHGQKCFQGLRWKYPCCWAHGRVAGDDCGYHLYGGRVYTRTASEGQEEAEVSSQAFWVAQRNWTGT
jgi:hypothetical protein